jgi:hypothetical protein
MIDPHRNEFAVNARPSGSGSARLFVFRHRHEVENGCTSSVARRHGRAARRTQCATCHPRAWSVRCSSALVCVSACMRVRVRARACPCACPCPCLCVCTRACVRACVHMRVRVCVCEGREYFHERCLDVFRHVHPSQAPWLRRQRPSGPSALRSPPLSRCRSTG